MSLIESLRDGVFYKDDDLRTVNIDLTEGVMLNAAMLIERLQIERESLKSELSEARQALASVVAEANEFEARILGGIRVNSGRDTIFRIYAVGRDLVSPEDEDFVKCKTNATLILDEGVEL